MSLGSGLACCAPQVLSVAARHYCPQTAVTNGQLSHAGTRRASVGTASHEDDLSAFPRRPVHDTDPGTFRSPHTMAHRVAARGPRCCAVPAGPAPAASPPNGECSAAELRNHDRLLCRLKNMCGADSTSLTAARKPEKPASCRGDGLSAAGDRTGPAKGTSANLPAAPHATA